MRQHAQCGCSCDGWQHADSDSPVPGPPWRGSAAAAPPKLAACAPSGMVALSVELRPSLMVLSSSPGPGVDPSARASESKRCGIPVEASKRHEVTVMHLARTFENDSASTQRTKAPEDGGHVQLKTPESV